MSDGMAPEAPPPDTRRRRARRSGGLVIDPPSPDEVREALQGAAAAGPGGPARIKEVAEGAPVGALADAIGELPVEAMRQVLSALGPERLAEVIAEVDPWTRPSTSCCASPVRRPWTCSTPWRPTRLRRCRELREENAPAAEQLLQEMEPEEAANVRQLLTYPDDTAGGIMTTDYLAVVGVGHRRRGRPPVRAPGATSCPRNRRPTCT